MQGSPPTCAYPCLKHVFWTQLPQGGSEKKTKRLFEDTSSTVTHNTVGVKVKVTMAHLISGWNQNCKPPHSEREPGGRVGQLLLSCMVIKPCPCPLWSQCRRYLCSGRWDASLCWGTLGSQCHTWQIVLSVLRAWAGPFTFVFQSLGCSHSCFPMGPCSLLLLVSTQLNSIIKIPLDSAEAQNNLWQEELYHNNQWNEHLNRKTNQSNFFEK